MASCDQLLQVKTNTLKYSRWSPEQKKGISVFLQGGGGSVQGIWLTKYKTECVFLC